MVEVTGTSVKLPMQPEGVTNETMTGFERFVVLLYDKTCTFDRVDEARMYMFTKRSREIENIRPIPAALN